MLRQQPTAPVVTLPTSSFRTLVESLVAAGFTSVSDLARLPRQPYRSNGKWVSL